MDNLYFPKIPENVTDLATRTSGLDKAGLMSLRQGGDPTKYKVDAGFYYNRINSYYLFKNTTLSLLIKLEKKMD